MLREMLKQRAGGGGAPAGGGQQGNNAMRGEFIRRILAQRGGKDAPGGAPGAGGGGGEMMRQWRNRQGGQSQPGGAESAERAQQLEKRVAELEAMVESLRAALADKEGTTEGRGTASSAKKNG
jgi:hypothetical protein